MAIDTALIPAAGQGKRIAGLKFTGILPKPLLPVFDRPIAQYALETSKAMGARKIGFIIGKENRLIEQYFGNGADFDVEVEYFTQAEPKGIGHALMQAREFAGKKFSTR